MPIAQEELKTGGMISQQDARSEVDEAASMKSGIERMKSISSPLTQDEAGGPKFTQTMTTQTDYGVTPNNKGESGTGVFMKGKGAPFESRNSGYIRVDRQSPNASKTSSEIKKSFKGPTERKKEKEAQRSVVKPVDFLNMNQTMLEFEQQRLSIKDNLKA